MEIEGVKFLRGFDGGKLEWSEAGNSEHYDIPVLYVVGQYWDDEYSDNHTAKAWIWLGDRIIAQLPEEEYITGGSEEECKLKTEQWIKEKLSQIVKKII